MSGSLQRGWRTTNRPGRMTLPHYDDQRCNCLQSIVFLCPFLNSILLCLEIILLCFFFRKARLICDIGSELFKKECNSFGLFEPGRMESGGTLAALHWKFVSSGVDQYGDEPTDSLWGCNHTESALNELS